MIWGLAAFSSLFFFSAHELEHFAASILLALLWAALSLAKLSLGRIEIPQSWILRLIGAFWLLMFLSILWAEILYVSFLGFCFLSIFPLTVFVFIMRGDAKDMIRITKAASFVFLCLALWAIAQNLFFEHLFDGQSRHPFKNPNSFAAFMALGFFCALGWMLGTDKTQEKIYAGIVCTCLAGSIIATTSRGVPFAVFMVLPVFLILLRQKLKTNLKPLLLVLAGISTLFVIMELDSKIDQEYSLGTRTAQSFESEADVFSNRTNIWKTAVNIVKESPWIGHGVGTFYLYYSEHRVKEDIYGTHYAHNDPLQFWAEMGILAPVLFYAILALAFWRTRTALQHAEEKQEVLIITLFCALGTALLHTHISFNFYNLATLYVMGFLFAAWFLATQKALETPSPLKAMAFPDILPKSLRPVLTTMPFLMIGALFFCLIASEYFVNKAQKQILDESGIETYANHINKADQLSFGTNFRAYLLAATIPIGILEGRRGTLSLEEEKQFFEQAQAYLSQALHLNPRSATARYHRANLYGITPHLVPEDGKDRKTLLQEALRYDPRHYQARIDLANLYLANGDEASALSLLEEIKNWRHLSVNAENYLKLLAGLYLKQGEPEKSQNVLSQLDRLMKFLNSSK